MTERLPLESLQQRVQPWLLACFGQEIAGDRIERNHRFLEESLELVQACGCTASEAHQLVDYVFGRPVGQKEQEAGGVMVTLAALCLAQGLDMHLAAEVELGRIWGKVDQIRAKQAAKPKHSPLPVSPAPSADEIEFTLIDAFEIGYAFSMDVHRPQSREDSRAVGRLLMSDTFEGIHEQIAMEVERKGFDSFKDADSGIVQCKAIIHAVLAAIQPQPVTGGVAAIATERRRQIDSEGWTLEHDDEHGDDLALARAAACYALAGTGGTGPFWITHLQVPQQVWPYRWEWKPKGRRSNLVRAGALIAAEIDRIDRAAMPGADTSKGRGDGPSA